MPRVRLTFLVDIEDQTMSVGDAAAERLIAGGDIATLDALQDLVADMPAIYARALECFGADMMKRRERAAKAGE